jgi:hypothetical protein
MKLKCPACGAPVSATDINVQQMVAVCPHCDNIFKFEAMFAPQQRKIKAPEQFHIGTDDPSQLDIAFKWSLRTEPPIAQVLVPVMFVVFFVLALAMLVDGAPLAIAALPFAMSAWMGFVRLTLLVNQTHYESDGETLKVYTEPLYYPRYGRKNIPISEIRDVTVERPGYAPFPEGKAGFYNVYVHTHDGDKIQIATYVNYEHAHFIAQELKTHLQSTKEVTARLEAESNDEENVVTEENFEQKQLHSQG